MTPVVPPSRVPMMVICQSEGHFQDVNAPSNSSHSVFVPFWTLTEKSHFGEDQNCVVFALHAFPPHALEEVASTSHAEAVQTLRVFSGQTAMVLAQTANRFDDLSVFQDRDIGMRRSLQESASLNGKLQEKVVDLEGRARILESQVGEVERLKRLADGKVTLLESSLGVAREELVERREENHVLQTEVGRLEREVMEQNQLLLDHEAQLALVRDQLRWVLEEGVAAAVDRVLDSTTFGSALQRYGRICQESCERIGRQALHDQLGLPMPSSTEPVMVAQQALEDLARVDYVAMFRLRGLSFSDLQRFYQSSTDPSSSGLQ